jgi:hypothetical protein
MRRALEQVRLPAIAVMIIILNPKKPTALSLLPFFYILPSFLKASGSNFEELNILTVMATTMYI